MTEYKLIPVSQEKVAKAQEKLTKVYKSFTVEQFIDLYNAGLLPSGNAKVKDIASNIASAYQNVKSFANKLVIKTEEEVAFDASIELLKAWKTVSTLKRITTQMLEESFEPDTNLLFIANKPGVVHFEGLDENGEITIEPYWLRDKVVTSNKALANNIFLGKSVFEYDPEEKIIGIKLSDVSQIDDSFALKLQKDLIETTFKATGQDIEFYGSDEEDEEEDNTESADW